MDVAFGLTALITLAGAVAAVWLRNLVHAVLALAVSFAGVAAAYLQLGAEFLGFAQLLIYVGAVAILIVFAVLVTRGGEVPAGGVHAARWWVGALVALGVFAVLGWAASSLGDRRAAAEWTPMSVAELGQSLVGRWVFALQVLGILLTAALIGAVLLAWREEGNDSGTHLGGGES
ncbi:MAG: NADH-quinone oxidoreductase subunit J [Verrucomicrobiota bacterium]|nr:NADH-quinone oxidoreductase subunit J [Limisphaera sp.]MDW8381316.1 NADH-quinone oxidoreductase subunit J [Verrucomicrobiota bacterium]